ncbi:hypothetical protein NDU88_007327 [Pleurodeles waltl]|uniref:Uncharacterized protein n=1 Tax=Pleurodeles waltl TaxID=8319 RepID=A0AAV7QRI9_PLEWA|nr:hypothetical protein NDU88_007327 [Pleurodeles waltl]
MQSSPVPVSTAGGRASHPGTAFCRPVSAAQQPQQGNRGRSRCRSPTPATILGASRPGSPPPHSQPRNRLMSSVRREGHNKAPSPITEQPQQGNQNPAYLNLQHGPCRRPPTPVAILGVSRLGCLSAHRRSMSSVCRGDDKGARVPLMKADYGRI